MEAEYAAASRCVCEIKFVNKLTDWCGLPRCRRDVHEDNSACIAISTNPVHRQRSKHIAVKYHNVRDACKDGDLQLTQVWTEHQVADIFTKSLTTKPFERFRSCLVGSSRIPMVHFDLMIQNHVKEEQKKETIGKQQINHYGYCKSCDAKTKESSYVLKRVKAPNGKIYGVWPLYEVPFRKDCEIKKELIDGWFDTRCIRTKTMIA